MSAALEPGFSLFNNAYIRPTSITQYCEEHSMAPEDCVAEMRRIVCEETKLTASAGIAPNRVSPLSYPTFILSAHILSDAGQGKIPPIRLDTRAAPNISQICSDKVLRDVPFLLSAH